METLNKNSDCLCKTNTEFNKLCGACKLNINKGLEKNWIGEKNKMENEKIHFDNIETPVYFFIENNKIHIDVEEMEREFDFKVNALVKKFN